MASSTLELSTVEAQVVTDCLHDELRAMADALAECVQYAPIESGHALDARWKVERLGVCIALLERIGFIEPRTEDAGGYAGTLWANEEEVRS